MRRPAWAVRCVSGGLGEGDGEAERFELADVAAGSLALVEFVVVVAGAELLVSGGGSASRFQTITRMERATATSALALPRRLTTRSWRWPRKVFLVLAAAAAASPRTPLR
jgi:hypothetical protein